MYNVLVSSLMCNCSVLRAVGSPLRTRKLQQRNKEDVYCSKQYEEEGVYCSKQYELRSRLEDV